MTSPRRLGAEDSSTRTTLLDATAQIILEEGYAAVSSRRVAAKAGIKPALVHYYFRTMDDLFLAVFRRGAEANLERQRRALASPRPLRALWDVDLDSRGTTLMVEFMALANHRKAIRSEIAAYAERFREAELATLSRVLTAAGVDPATIPPVVVTCLMASVSRVLVMEGALGMTMGHRETIDLVERYLTEIEARTPPDPVDAADAPAPAVSPTASPDGPAGPGG
ncbi:MULTISPECIES: TetR/AcrR family transcriptional regulator [Parafrankia]|uniref:TetR/AcrR family transcriptional regulator n=2 Tax=Frankiaceae TaxID=74712 RepID=UPI0000544CA9|nr:MULTISPECIES: TetR/AcrR family transcriptional regulator [Parafrankia]ABW10174.1 transcriptional regulator, TetR family [Frankia sp. EAN1pec]TCJ31839.1 TetR/AcrR family transcriptional regulator [Parafrankia sp. BMG5.11]